MGLESLPTPSFRQPWRQLLAQQPECPSHPGFHRLHGHPHDGGDLGIGQAILAAPLEGLPHVIGKAGDGGPGEFPELAHVRARVGAGDGRRGAHHRLGAGRHLAVPEIVERQVPRRLVQVRAKRGLGHERFPPSPELEQHLLRDILCRRGIPQDSVGRADEPRVVLAEERLEGGIVTGSAPREKGEVVHELQVKGGWPVDALVRAG